MQEKIIKDMTQAMKEQNKFVLSVLRMLKSALQLEKISKNHDLSDEEVINVIKKQVKARKDSIVEYEKYERQDEVTKLKQEIEVLSAYLPAELSEAEIDKALDKIFAEIKPASIKDMGKVMKLATARLAGQADGKAISAKVRQLLAK